MSYEAKIKELGVTVPEAPKPVAVYVPGVQAGNLIYTAGQIPLAGGELKFKGKVGKDLTTEEGYEAARICALNCLGVVKSMLGSLDKIERIVKVTGFVNSAPGFTGQPKVIDGASELLGEIFSEQGRHARSAVGVAELPVNAAVEVEIIIQVK
ncbi:MAG TPA: RidA family protein [Clostridia bacterium]|nr:RidA family protein [Clostridia bacterium]